MAYQPNKVLAEALKVAKKAAADGVLEHSALDPKYTEALKRSGYLTPVIRGWYLLSKPEPAGSTSIWYAGFWSFIRAYLLKRFGKHGYCLSAEASVDLHTGEEHIAQQLTALTKKDSNQKVELPQQTSLVLYADTKNYPKETEQLNGINVMPLALALCRLPPSYYRAKPLNVELGLRLLPSVAEVSRCLLEGGLVTDAGRIIGGFRAIGEIQKAEQITKDMQAAGFAVQEVNPFKNHVVSFGKGRVKSPYGGRIEAQWMRMRPAVVKAFPNPPGISRSKEKRVMKVILDRYEQDAYHSLSIEGYAVTEDLIHRIEKGGWDPQANPDDHQQVDAMAAKGYHDTFQCVVGSISKVINGKNPGEVFADDLQDWYRALFSPSVRAGLLKAGDLAGYRSSAVFIKGSRHVPPRHKEAVLDAMETLFRLLSEEEHAGVRAVLGHFFFVYIHPYVDGNGRIGRLLLNMMFVTGGYSWTVIRSERRSQYMRALEAASTEGNIEPFAKFVRAEHDHWSK